jgi:hypothetical protein
MPCSWVNPLCQWLTEAWPSICRSSGPFRVTAEVCAQDVHDVPRVMLGEACQPDISMYIYIYTNQIYQPYIYNVYIYISCQPELNEVEKVKTEHLRILNMSCGK